MPSTIEIFCCYAREDQPLLEHLTKHLMLLQRQGLVSIWSDTNINAGDEWEKAVHAHLDTAHIILLLISPDFMASDYCYSTEMQHAMQRHSQGDVRVIPILLRHTLWKGAPFANLQMLPKDAKPVASWLDKDEPLYSIADQISLLVKVLQIQHALKEAEQLSNDRRYEGALVLYDQALAQEPQNIHAYIGKAKTLFHLQRYEESLVAFEASEQIDPGITDVDFYQQKASALYQLKRYEESLFVHDKALQICLSDTNKVSYHFAPGICLEKADIFLLLKRYPEALEAYEQAIALRPGASGLYMRKGDLLFRLGNFDSALKMYEQAIGLKPWEISYYEQKGKLLLEWQRYEEALVAFEQVLTLSTRPQPQYYEQKGQALLKLERYEEALVVYEKALKATAQYEKVLQDVKVLRDVKEDSSYLHSGKGQALLALERYEEALAAFAKAIELCAPNNIDPQFYHHQGIAYERLAQRAYEMEQESRLLWLQKQDEEPFFISPPETKESLLNIDKFTLLRTLKGHKGSINCIAISQDGQWLVSGSSDQTIKIWKIATGEELRSVRGYATAVYSVVISPDGQTLVTGSDISVTISSDGKILVSGGTDKIINVWELATGKVLQTLNGHEDYVKCVAISLDGQKIVSGSYDGRVKLWQYSTEQEPLTLGTLTRAVTSVAISPDGQKIVSGGLSGTINVWELAARSYLCTLERRGTPGVTSVAISPDGQKIICGCSDGTIEIWGVQ